MKTLKGFEVIRFEKVGDDEAIVMIEGWNNITPFVVWNVRISNEECWWGHYKQTREGADSAFETKLANAKIYRDFVRPTEAKGE